MRHHLDQRSTGLVGAKILERLVVVVIILMFERFSCCLSLNCDSQRCYCYLWGPFSQYHKGYPIDMTAQPEL